MNRQITLPYGHESRTIAVPEENLAWVEGPKDAPPVPGLREAVNSRPADRDLRQGFKPVNDCGMVVKDGGTLILLIPAPEGIAPDQRHGQSARVGVVTQGADIMATFVSKA